MMMGYFGRAAAPRAIALIRMTQKNEAPLIRRAGAALVDSSQRTWLALVLSRR